jgi:hypothetical protein
MPADEGDIVAQAADGFVNRIWIRHRDVAITQEGIQVGDSRAQVMSTYAGRTTVIPPDPQSTHRFEAILIDASSLAEPFSYLFEIFEGSVSLIVIADDPGRAEGPCV